MERNKTAKAHICPHFNLTSNENNIQLQILFSSVARSRTLYPEMFYHTHTKMQLFGSKSTKPINEDEVLNSIKAKAIGNHVIVITGNTGTGKSELCAYLYLELKKQGRHVLYADKDDTLHDIVSHKLRDFLEETLNVELEYQKELDEFARAIKSQETKENVAVFMASGMLMSFHLPDFDGVREKLAKLIEERLELLHLKKGIGTEINLIPTNDLQHQKYDFVRKIASKISNNLIQAVHEMNKVLWENLYIHFKIPRFKEIIEHVSRLFKEKDIRPVMIFEDFSLSTPDTEELRKYLASDNPTNCWDFIIAGVPDRIQPLREDSTVMARFQFLRTHLEEKSSQVPHLNESNCVEFIGKFLNFTKVSDGSIKVKGNVVYPTEPKPQSKCMKCSKCSYHHRSLFPFNEVFLQNIFNGIREEKKPRTYVEIVFGILEEYAHGVPPHLSKKLKESIRLPFLPKEGLPDNIAGMGRWYGKVTNGSVGLELELLQLLTGIRKSDIKSDFKVRDGVVFVPGEIYSVSPRDIEDLEENRIDDETFIRLRGDIFRWLDDPLNTSTSELNEYMLDVIGEGVRHMTGLYSLSLKSKIRYFIGRNKKPINHISSHIESFQIPVETKLLTEKRATELLKIGINLHNRIEKNTAAIVQAAPLFITDAAQRWQEHINSQIINYDFARSDWRYKCNIPQITIIAIIFLQILIDPWVPLNYKTITDLLFSSSNVLDANMLERLRLVLGNEVSNLEELGSYEPAMKQLANEFLSIKEKTLDKQLLEKTLVSIDDLLKWLSKTSFYRFAKKHSLRFLDYKIEDLFKILHKCKRILFNDLPKQFTKEKRQEIYTETKRLASVLHSVDQERIQGIIRRLETFSFLQGRPFLANLVTISKILNDDPNHIEIIKAISKEILSIINREEGLGLVKTYLSYEKLVSLPSHSLLCEIYSQAENLSSPAEIASSLIGRIQNAERRL